MKTDRLRSLGLVAATCLILASEVGAKIDLVTLPKKDTTQLTIYKSEDLTLVRESRELTFRKGLNQIQFSWANTLIDPTSLQIEMKGRPQDFKVLDAVYPATASFQVRECYLTVGESISLEGGTFTLTRVDLNDGDDASDDEVELLVSTGTTSQDTRTRVGRSQFVEDFEIGAVAIFGSGTAGRAALRLTNANSENPGVIIWNIDAAIEGKATAEITYFASGLTWRADYTAVANDDETALRIEPDFTITNNSGEDFENASTRLVVGEINLVEAIAELARRGFIAEDSKDQFRQQFAQKLVGAKRDFNEDGDDSMFLGMAVGGAGAEGELKKAKEILKAAVSEYYLYSIEGEEDLQTGWGKQLPNPRTDGVKIDVSYEYNPSKYGGGTIKFYKFKNDGDHKIGDVPMPEGQWYVYSGDTRGGLRFQGSWQHKYVPIGEDVELNLGSDGLVIVEERQMDLTRTNFEFNDDGNVIGYDIVETREVEIRNARNRAVPMKITLKYGTSDWEASNETDAFKKVDRETLEWKLDAPATDRKIIRYTLTTRTGSRDRSNK